MASCLPVPGWADDGADSSVHGPMVAVILLYLYDGISLIGLRGSDDMTVRLRDSAASSA